MFCLYVLAQILLESLPISSSAHTALLGLSAPQSVDFLAHGPTALMLLIYFRDEVYTFISQRTFWWSSWFHYGLKIFVAELVTGAFFLFYKWIGPLFPLWVGLVITALMLLSLRLVSFFVPRHAAHEVGWPTALLVACAQGLSLMMPGVSRLASTLAVARWAGLEEHVAFRFSCALQVPLFGAAALLGLWQCQGVPVCATLFSAHCLLGIAGAMLGAYVLLAFVERLYSNQGLWIFGIYMFVPLILSLFF